MLITSSDWSIILGAESFKSFNGNIENAKLFINPKTIDPFI